MSFTYPKAEKLCSKNIIDKLFTGNKPLYEHPLKVFWIVDQLPENVPVQSIVTASKRRFKRAYKRNLLKRRMREAFRLNKEDLYINVKAINTQLALMIIYNHGEILPYQQIEPAMKAVLKRIASKLNNTSSNLQNQS